MAVRATFTELEPYKLTGVTVTDRELGHGSHATVLELKCMGLRCAGKKIHEVLLKQGDTNYTVRRFEEECRLLSQVRHPNIVQFLGVHFQEGVPAPILVMEFLPTNLTSCIEQYGIFPKEISYSILHDVALGLCYLHSQTPPIIHRDLSSNNVLFASNMTAKISDLGVARILNLTPLQVSHMTQTPGTPIYMPPEVMIAKPDYNTSIDQFSYGIMMIHMFSCRWPEPQVGQTRIEGNQLIPVTEAERREVFLRAIGNDHPLMDLILMCISNDPRRRPHASEIVERLSVIKLQFPTLFANQLEMLSQIERKEEEKQALREEGEAEIQRKDQQISSLRQEAEERKEESVRLTLLYSSEVEKLSNQLQHLKSQKQLLVSNSESEIHELITKLKVCEKLCETQIETYDTILQKVSVLQNEISSRDAELSQKNAELSRKDAELSQKNTELSSKDAEMSRKDDELTIKDAEMSKKDDELSRKDAELSRKDAELSRKDAELSRKDAELSRKDTELSRKDAELSRKDTELSRKGNELSNKDTVLSRKFAELSRKDTELSRKDVQLSRKDAELTMNVATINKKESELESHTQAIKDKDSIIIAMNEQLTRLREYLPSKKQVVQVGITWKQCAEIPSKFSLGMSTVINGKVYCGGGMTDIKEDQLNVYCYDPLQDNWTTLPPLSVRWFGLGQVSGKLVAVGGKKKSNDTPSNEVFTYDEQSRKWKLKIPPMPTARHSPSILSLQSALAVVGGYTERADSVEIFKADTSQWYCTDPLPTACSSISLTCISNTCYAIGGFHYPSRLNQAFYASVEDLLHNAVPINQITHSGSSDTQSAWKTLPNTPTYQAAAAVLGDTLLAIGGREASGLDAAATVYTFFNSPSTNSWIYFSDLPEPRTSPVVTVLSPTEILVIGGWCDGRVNTVYKGTLQIKV